MEFFGALVNLWVPLLLIVLAWFTGRYAERRHFQRLRRREAQLGLMLVTDVKSFPGGADPARGGRLVMGQVVVASDYLKSFLAALRKIFGGELKSFESLMERARREATLRMMEEAHRQGHDAVCNFRLDFSDIGSMSNNKGGAMVEVFVSGTAYTRPAQPSR